MKSTAAVAHNQRSPFVVEEVALPDLQHTHTAAWPQSLNDGCPAGT